MRGSVSKAYGNRNVFLSPDEHSVIVLWPNQDGTESKQRFPLHNVIYADLRVRIARNPNGFAYGYDLENERQSEDSVTTFSIVIYPDTQLHAKGESWAGMEFTSIVGKRIGIPGVPDGGLELWSCPDTLPLLPGKATKFTLMTEARPGFTTASTEHYPHLDLTDEWPERILDELDPVLAPEWIDQHIITLGPRYGPNEPRTRIASDYVVGIQELIRQGRLQKNSPF